MGMSVVNCSWRTRLDETQCRAGCGASSLRIRMPALPTQFRERLRRSGDCAVGMKGLNAKERERERAKNGMI